jgi:predicted aldo/keto reductase-like oxidoreductase
VGVEIPICFESYNNLLVFGNVSEKQLRYAIRLGGVLSGGKPGLASQCIQCGECMEKCPQHLKIPDLLKAVVEELQGADWEQTMVKAKKIFQENLTLR